MNTTNYVTEVGIPSEVWLKAQEAKWETVSTLGIVFAMTLAIIFVCKYI